MAPDIYAYLDYRLFLQEWFEAKKSDNPRYSHRVFARHAGLASPALLANVIARRRNLTAASQSAFVRAMRLSPSATSFFSHLVDLDQSKTPENRNKAWARISATRRFRQARRVEGESVAYLSHWYYPAIRELADCAAFQADPEWIARTLCPRITVSQARRALDALVSMGMLTIDADGAAHLTDATVVTPMEVAGLATHNYHQGMLERAQGAISGFAPEHRYLGGVTVAIPAGLIDTLKDELKAVQERLLDLCDSAEGTKRQVMQINLQLFPLSAPTDGDSE
jgi:uncharacterized protein (TIGR02147 family)